MSNQPKCCEKCLGNHGFNCIDRSCLCHVPAQMSVPESWEKEFVERFGSRGWMKDATRIGDVIEYISIIRNATLEEAAEAVDTTGKYLNDTISIKHGQDIIRSLKK